MFFLRPDYEYGNPKEQPEPFDVRLAIELDEFNESIPSIVTENITDYTEDFYKGPLLDLYFLAVTYEVRQMSGGNPNAVTTSMYVAALSNRKNWPTRGTLLINDGRRFEMTGEDCIPLDGDYSWLDR